MDIFFVMPIKENSVVFLHTWKEYILNTEISVGNSVDSVDLVSFPIHSNVESIDIKDFELDSDEIRVISSHILDFLKDPDNGSKMGTLLLDTPNTFKFVLRDVTFMKNGSRLTAMFNLYNNPVIFESMHLTTLDNGVILTPENDSYLHNFKGCHCDSIKKANNILMSSCLFCLEQEAFLINWLEDQYLKQLKENKISSNIIPFFPRRNFRYS